MSGVPLHYPLSKSPCGLQRYRRPSPRGTVAGPELSAHTLGRPTVAVGPGLAGQVEPPDHLFCNSLLCGGCSPAHRMVVWFTMNASFLACLDNTCNLFALILYSA
jgi:hypothetical protein